MSATFTSFEPASAYVASLGSGFHVGYFTEAEVTEAEPLLVFTSGTRAFEVALAVVEAGRGAVDPAPAWFAYQAESPATAEGVEAQFQAVEAGQWAVFMAYVESGFSEPEHERGEYDAFLVANGLPVFTGAADAYLEALGEVFLGD